MSNSYEYLLYFFTILLIGYILYNKYFNNTYEGINFKRIARKAVNSIIRPIKRGLEKPINDIRRPVEDAVRKVSQLDKVVNDMRNFFNKQINAVKDLVNKIKNSIIKEVNKAVNTMKKLTKEVKNKIESVAKLIIDKIKEFTLKIAKMFKAFGEIIYDGIILPIAHFFAGFAKVFREIFEILMKIVNKIISLPDCMPSYMVSGMYDMIKLYYKLLVPGFIRSFISLIYKYIISPMMTLFYYVFIYPLELILNMMGLSLVKKYQKWRKNIKKKCYDFNLKGQIKNMGRAFEKMAVEFANNFGRLDFSKLNVF